MYAATTKISAMFIGICLLALPIIAQADEDFHCDAIELLEKLGPGFTHVKCRDPLTVDDRNPKEIKYIVVRNEDSERLKRFQDLAAQAIAFDEVYFIARVPVSGTDNIDGCSPEDCREATRFGIYRP